jgi:hypothetical protein
MATKKKKPRSAKQKANDKRLGLAAKKRAAQNKPKKKTTKRKVSKTSKKKNTVKSRTRRLNLEGVTNADIQMIKNIKRKLSEKGVKAVKISK